jgi:hypothetical protein
MIEKLLSALGAERHEIGRRGLTQYLTRWVLYGRRGVDGTRRNGPGGKVFLHHFHNGDPEDYDHDHPFAFWSLILWGGYYEHSPSHPGGVCWYGPGRLLQREAHWRHRVKTAPGRTCWTLVWTGPKTRLWGFWCSTGWIGWRQHEANEQRTGTGCGVE